MENRTTIGALCYALILSAFMSTFCLLRAQDSPPLPPGVAYYSMRYGTNLPPLPGNILSLPQYPLGDGRWVVDDRFSGHDFLTTSPTAASGSEVTDDVNINPGSGGDTNSSGGSTTNVFIRIYNTNQLWLQITGVTNSYIYVELHGPISNTVQLQLTTDVSTHHTNWIPGETDYIGSPTSATNVLAFKPIYMAPSQVFFRAQLSDGIASVTAGHDAVRPVPDISAFDGWFVFSANYSTNAAREFAINFRMSGTATNGSDYTFLDSPFVFDSAGTNYPYYLYVDPLSTTNIVFDEQVILSLQPGDNYLVIPDATNSVATINLIEQWTNSFFQLVTSNLYYPNGVAYNPLTNSLIVANGGVDSGSNVTFCRISTNGTISSWTGISISEDEPNQIIIQTNLGGFTNAVMYYANGNNGGIGWLSPNGSVSNLNWLNIGTEDAVIGSLYADTTGVFSNSLIAVTGDLGEASDGKVWIVGYNTTARLLTTITNLGHEGLPPAMEGVTTVPNDSAQFGPWAGQILAGSEDPTAIFAINTNGVVTSYDFGIQVEDIHIIPTNQDFYITRVDDNALFKLPRNLLTNYVGDILITQEGLNWYGTYPPKLFIYHWDAGSTNFLIRSIHSPYPVYDNEFEQGVFAPISIPATPISDQ